MKIDCVIPHQNDELTTLLINVLQNNKEVNKIFILCNPENIFSTPNEIVISTIHPESSDSMKKIAVALESEYLLFLTQNIHIRLGQNTLYRMASVAKASCAGLVYADYYTSSEGNLKNHPLIDYQLGSGRDDFNMGSLLLFNSAIFKQAVYETETDYNYAGLYDIRLKISQKNRIIRINEFLYTVIENDTRSSGLKQFDYVDPRNREVQIEKEKAFTNHLKKIDAYLEPKFKKVKLDKYSFEYEASVIIPVKNRAKTIADAIQSVLIQQTDFKFNLIIIDNHSTDGTTNIITRFASGDNRIIHIIPERKDLGIGGCWNEGVVHPLCGKFTVQLDSDDLYKDGHTLQKIVNLFYEQECAMVIGSYIITDFDLKMIPPGIIDHKEWTPDNGRNNALRINGLGAPRAFYTPLLREIKVPDTSYGEDYALGLAFSREHQIGRIYDVLYICRRWEENSDASLNVEKLNAHNLYKDKLRTIEILARQQLNKTTINYDGTC
jgi:hypothetical protein